MNSTMIKKEHVVARVAKDHDIALIGRNAVDPLKGGLSANDGSFFLNHLGVCFINGRTTPAEK